MSAYPIVIDLQDRPCLVVGGGRIALRKTLGLVRAGARVTVIAPVFHRHFSLLASRITMIVRPFTASDITTALTLVIGATDVTEVNAAVSRRAAELRVPCNIVDRPELCSVMVPAVVRRGDLTIAVASGGTSPRLSRYVKQRIAACIGPEYAELAAYCKAMRLRVRDLVRAPEDRAAFWEQLFADDPIDFIAKNGWPAFCERAEAFLRAVQERSNAL